MLIVTHDGANPLSAPNLLDLLAEDCHTRLSHEVTQHKLLQALPVRLSSDREIGRPETVVRPKLPRFWPPVEQALQVTSCTSTAESPTRFDLCISLREMGYGATWSKSNSREKKRKRYGHRGI